MRYIELTRIPFGRFFVLPEHVGEVTPAENDPFQGMWNGQPYGCCLLVQGEERRVKEGYKTVLALLGRESVENLLQDPAPPAEVVLEVPLAPTTPKKKAKK